MALKKETPLGVITVNDSVIAKAIIRSAMKVGEKLILATEKGRVLGAASKVGAGELAGAIKAEENQGKCHIEFYGVIAFGASISGVTEKVLSAMEKEMKTMFPEWGGTIVLKIVGVKSRNIAPRSIEVKKQYEAAR